ncbi:MAG: tetraacyldisaccharide 4'-kinase [Ginsengibacter sp.]
MVNRFRYILLPLSFLYGLVISFRNWLYDKNILRSASFNFPIICVGNLAVGGTGKTPMVEYITRLLKDRYNVATLSRGYKRKTKGFAIAGDLTTALDIGDEPMQFHSKFPDITVAVAEERVVGIPQLLHDKPETNVIVLDDAFQHRQVKAGLNILLTEYLNPYTDDFMLPAGNLRDVKSSRRRADIIIISKCPPALDLTAKQHGMQNIDADENQSIYFSAIGYDTPYHLFSGVPKTFEKEQRILLICGIANPTPIIEEVSKQFVLVEHLLYRDHHIFNIDDLQRIKKTYENHLAENVILLTTEKDGVRLSKFQNELKELPVYVLPIQHNILFGEEDLLNKQLIDFVNSYNKTSNI